MAKRFFTADWHLCDLKMLTILNRPFSDVFEMNSKLIENANNTVNSDDMLVHLGDFLIYGGYPDLKVNPTKFIEQINGTFINVEGNHDPTNKTKSIGRLIQTKLGNTFPDVSMGHYPSWYPEIKDFMRPGWIHLCGHVHGKWKHYLEQERQILNINVGVDVWNYKPVSELELIRYIMSLFKK